ncbi:transporter substrate-binding domain-containing protein [Alsobacter sp. SYSU M60028]|uniref:Transporter substrate-binding domain-containing protein n=1 Tax=Alsobacter ponti TaxID=2962936 RepID=A0ABT1L9C0_9HYPH|nr:transporter substrate-binding domain-containing protein [Alsobacter ponti]MCP8937648.1 transporter substrate-binding domain-containing protein [Alsobacter ponti]
MAVSAWRSVGCAGLALLALAVPAAAPLAREWRTVRIATEGAYPPFNFTDADNQLRGFEVDLGKALCARMKVECVFVQEDWDNLIRGLRRDRFDAIMASMEITDERRERIAFSRRYYRTPPVFMIRTDSDVAGVSPEALKGRRLGAMADTVYATYLQDLYGADSTVRLYANQDEASLDLALGRLDAVLGDRIALSVWLKRGREASCCRFLAEPPFDPAYFGEGYGVGLRKKDDDLRQMFDDAIASIQADGVYDEIRARYFDFDVK